MYPPVHRLLGWATQPSKLSLKRSVWRLDQLKAITYSDLLVKGSPAESDQATINRFPTLLDAVLLNKHSEKIANIADLIFDTKTGNILFYLVSRTNYKLPGTSRWRFDLRRITDQQPGCVYSDILSLEELPLVKSSLRQDLFNKSKKIRDNLYEISSIANQKLEGWLDDNDISDSLIEKDYEEINYNKIDNVDDDEDFYSSEYNRSNIFTQNGEDPWV